LELRYLRTHEAIAAWLLDRLERARLESCHAEDFIETMRLRVRLSEDEARHLCNAIDFEGIEAVNLTRR